jgi:hypothetical protein
MRGLPATLSPQYRSNINRFLCHLEQQGEQGSSWSDLVSADSGLRPAALEQAVNAGIRDHDLHPTTRAALNRAFGLLLQGESGRVRLAPTLPEHATLMRGLPAELSSSRRSRINRFLCHLEQQDRSWSDLVPADSGVRPAALEQAVNAGIRDDGLDINTRATLNRVFGLFLQAESGQVRLAPTLPAHATLMGGRSADTRTPEEIARTATLHRRGERKGIEALPTMRQSLGTTAGTTEQQRQVAQTYVGRLAEIEEFLHKQRLGVLRNAAYAIQDDAEDDYKEYRISGADYVSITDQLAIVFRQV